MTNELSHLDKHGKARMVDVGDKAESDRVAIAKGEVLMKPETFSVIKDGISPKGDILSSARIAGIMAAKRTSELIPLCHPLSLESIKLELTMDESLPGVSIRSEVRCHGKTGVEMEALTAVSVAALTVYDMVKAIEKTMKINNIRLVEKHGGKSGDIVNE